MPIDLPSDKHAMPAGRATASGSAASHPPSSAATAGTPTGQSGQPASNTGEASTPVRSSNATNSAPSSSSSSRPDQASVQAQVVEVKASTTSGSAAQVEAIVRFNGNPSSSSNGPVHAQLDRAVLEAIAQGKPTLVRVVTSAPLKIDQQLALRITDGQLQLQAIQAPSLAQQIARQVVPLVARQDSLAALLSNLVTSQNPAMSGAPSAEASAASPAASGDNRAKGREALLAAVVRALASNTASPDQGKGNTGVSVSPHTAPSAPGNSHTTPPQSPLQTALTRLWQQIPHLEQLTSAQGVKAAIRNSGLFLEAQLKQIDQPRSGNVPGPARPSASANATTAGAAPPQSGAGGPQAPLQADLKAILNQLVAALRATQSQPAGSQTIPASTLPVAAASGQPANTVTTTTTNPTATTSTAPTAGTGLVGTPMAPDTSNLTRPSVGETGPIAPRPATGTGSNAPLANIPTTQQAASTSTPTAGNLTASSGSTASTQAATPPTPATAPSTSPTPPNPTPTPAPGITAQPPAGQTTSGGSVAASGADRATGSSGQAPVTSQSSNPSTPVATSPSNDVQRPPPLTNRPANTRGLSGATNQPAGVATPGQQPPNTPLPQPGPANPANAGTVAGQTNTPTPATAPANTAGTASQGSAPANNVSTTGAPRGENTDTATRANLEVRPPADPLVYTRPRPLTGLASAPLRSTASETATSALSERAAPQPGNPLTFTAPPLPGHIPLQAHSIQRQTTRTRDFADALVSVLLKQGQQALSRLQLHQLSSLHHKNSSELGNNRVQNLLSFELPVWHGSDLSLIQFRIEESLDKPKQENEENEQARQWVVNLSFSLEGIGAIYCQASLSGVNANVTFWAKEPDTLALARNHLQELNDNLQAMGVRVNTLHCHPGEPPAQRDSIKQYLIDVQT